MMATLIIGGGAGGTGPLVSAAQDGHLLDWLSAGVALVERRDRLGGSIGSYAVNSDSLGSSFIEPLDNPAVRSLLAALLTEEPTRQLQALRHGFPSLEQVGRYLCRLGSHIGELLSRHSACRVLTCTEARALHVNTNGSITAELRHDDGSHELVQARTVIVALGGRQDVAAWLDCELAPGLRLADFGREKILPSDRLLRRGGIEEAAAHIGRHGTRVVILGGSHSAFSAAWLLITQQQIAFGPGDITILMRRKPRIFYPTRQSAAADGYPFGEDDVCPLTGRVNRLGGLRGDGRELWRRLTGCPGTRPEPRVAMRMAPHFGTAEIVRLLREAALIVPAFGYRAATLPVYDAQQHRILLAGETGASVSVGRDAHLLCADGSAVPNVFAIGLGTGYRPIAAMGGEPSFAGQQNSLWLMQNDLGRVVYEGVRAALGQDRWAA